MTAQLEGSLRLDEYDRQTLVFLSCSCWNVPAWSRLDSFLSEAGWVRSEEHSEVQHAVQQVL